MHYTKEQINAAKQTDLVDLAEAVGFTPKRVGKYYTLREHDSIIIYNRNTWHRNSTGYAGRGGSGGDAIDFLVKMCGMSFPEAVDKIISFNGISMNDRTVQKTLHGPSSLPQDKKMVLPPAAEKYSRLYAYLMSNRQIDKNVVNYFVRNHLIYESADHHNIVFCSTDKEGKVRHAFMRGTNDKFPFKGDVPGNDKNYGFNLVASNSEVLNVFEGAIDLMSYITLYENPAQKKDGRISDSSLLALGMLSDHPLERFLIEHPHIKEINFWLDNDYKSPENHGQEATKIFMEKYEKLGFVCRNMTEKKLPPGFKDINEFNKEVQKRAKEIKELSKIEKIARNSSR